MMPKMRSGRGLHERRGSRPSSMLRKPNASPQAARLNATGKPNSRNATSAQNMIGAMLVARKAIIDALRFARGLFLGFPLAQDRLRELELGRLVGRLQAGVRDQAREEGEALDEFGDRLEAEQRETDWQQREHGPADSARRRSTTSRRSASHG